MNLSPGLTWQEAKERCPEGVVPACHNAEDTVTVSGPAQAVHDFVVQLKEEGYFAREVSSNGVAFHSYYMAAIAPKLKQCLEKVSHTLSSHKLQNPLLYSMSMVIRNCLRLQLLLFGFGRPKI